MIGIGCIWRVDCTVLLYVQRCVKGGMSENDTDAGETCEPEARRLVRTAPVKLRPSLSRVSHGT
jgi:hypothetical protein